MKFGFDIAFFFSNGMARMMSMSDYWEIVVFVFCYHTYSIMFAVIHHDPNNCPCHSLAV
ncbi:hypothetical protein BCR42DRAFT_429004, partial [Absidia repens]